METSNKSSDFAKTLETAFSNRRLAPYLYKNSTEDIFKALSCYAWNTSLSESLYPSLQTLEIAIRNSLHLTIKAHFKTENWFEDPFVLYEHEFKKVHETKVTVLKQNKKYYVDQMIAELSFGFWTSLFDVRYEQHQRLWPKLLRSVFPYMPSRIRTRAIISKNLNKIRRLRNRIYHYEPIWHMPDLENQYSNIIEVINWINPHLKNYNALVDRFKDVYKNGYQKYHIMLERI